MDDPKSRELTGDITAALIVLGLVVLAIGFLIGLVGA